MIAFPPLVSRLIPNLGRDNDCEVVAVVRAIGASLRAENLDFHDLARVIECSGQPISSMPSPPASKRSTHRSPPASGTHSFGDMARACRDLDRGRLELREKQFVSDMCRRGFSFRPSPRQSSWLSDIFERLRGRAAA